LEIKDYEKTKQELRDYFKKFGALDVFLDTYVKIPRVFLMVQGDVDVKGLLTKTHVINKNIIKVHCFSLELETKTRNIMLQCYDGKLCENQVTNYFSRYGKILSKNFLGANQMFIKFTEYEAAADALGEITSFSHLYELL
jgi:hypothetical protein